MSEIITNEAGSTEAGAESMATYWALYGRLQELSDAQRRGEAQPWIVTDQFGQDVDVQRFAANWFAPKDEYDDGCDDAVHVLVSKDHYGIDPAALGLDPSEIAYELEEHQPEDDADNFYDENPDSDSVDDSGEYFLASDGQHYTASEIYSDFLNTPSSTFRTFRSYLLARGLDPAIFDDPEPEKIDDSDIE